MAQHNILGREGEYAACVYLLERDIHILERNWYGHDCEIDIIAEDYGEVIFIEVKTRTTATDDVRPEDAVDVYRMRRLRLAAQEYLTLHGLTKNPYRFDIIALDGAAPHFHIRHITHAFATEVRQPPTPRFPKTL